jgi:predicted AAA+ superfamily ATPase
LGVASVNLLKSYLVESWEYVFPELNSRDYALELVEDTRLLSIVGPRRAGKTFACFQLLKTKIGLVPPTNILYLNFEDERLYPLAHDLLQRLWDLYLDVINPDLSEAVYLALDEIQNVPNWSLWVRRMHDRYPKLRLV